MQLAFVVKVAVTLAAALMMTVQAPVPVQAPLQPVKVEPATAAAVNVTVLPAPKLAEQLALQALMPEGELLTVPEPVPALV